MAAESDLSWATAYAKLSQQHAVLVEQHATLAAAHKALLEQLESSGGGMECDENGERDSNLRRKIATSPQAAPPLSPPRRLIPFSMIVFPSEVMTLLAQLFKLMDTQNQGFLTEDSFALVNIKAYFATFGTWDELREFFDVDGNNVIDQAEFVHGFKSLAISQSYQQGAGQSASIQELAEHFQSSVTAFAMDKIYACHPKVKAQLDKAPRPINFGASPSNVVYSAKIEDKMVLDLSTTFIRLLNGDPSGSITYTSFMECGHDLGSWAKIQECFDEDQSGTIEEKEFLVGFKKWVLSQPINVPAGHTSVKAIMDACCAQSNKALEDAMTNFKADLASPPRK